MSTELTMPARTSAMHDRHAQRGANFFERDGFLLARDFGDVRAEYQALAQGAGLIDLAHFGGLRVEGGDHKGWLQKMITANVDALQIGQGAYSLLLEAKAHVLADFVLLMQNDHVLLYTSKSAREKLFLNLRRAVFREKVTLNDVGESLQVISLQGPSAKFVIEKTFQSIPALGPFQVVNLQFADSQLICVCNSRAGSDGYDLIVPRDAAISLWEALIANGAQPAGYDALNVARVEANIPWFEDDFDATTLAPEARLDKFIAENKGCYPGQEFIARIKNRGHVNRLLVQLEISGNVVPSRGDKIFVDSKQVGEITSAVRSFARNAPRALGYLRQELAEIGKRVQIEHGGEILNARVAQ